MTQCRTNIILDMMRCINALIILLSFNALNIREILDNNIPIPLKRQDCLYVIEQIAMEVLQNSYFNFRNLQNATQDYTFS